MLRILKVYPRSINFNTFLPAERLFVPSLLLRDGTFVQKNIGLLRGTALVPPSLPLHIQYLSRRFRFGLLAVLNASFSAVDPASTSALSRR